MKIDAIKLTPRERDILRLAHQGHDDASIASLLNISTRSISKHWEKLKLKSELSSRDAVVEKLADEPNPSRRVIADDTDDIEALVLSTSDKLYETDQLLRFAIFENKKVQEALSEGAERYITTLDNMLEGCQIIGYDWRYIYLNDAACHHARKTRDELVGKTLFEAFPGIQNSVLHERLIFTMEQRVHQLLENEFQYPDGSVGWFELSIQPADEGLFILSNDITIRKNAELTLRESEQRFRNLIESAPDAIFVQIDGKFAYANRWAIDLFGAKTKDELIGLPVVTLFDPEDHAIVKERIRSINEERARLPRKEFVCCRLDGRRLAIEVSGGPIEYHGHNGAIVFAHDISERKRAEQAVLESEAKYRSIVEDSTDFIGIVIDGQIVYMNPSALSFFGFSSLDETIGKPVLELVHPDHRQMMADRLARTITNWEPNQPIRFTCIRGDGKAIHVEGISRPFFYQGKKAIHILVRDLTYREETERKISDAMSLTETVISSSPVGILAFSRDRSILWINSEARRILGVKPDDKAPESLIDIAQWSRIVLQDTVKQVIKTGVKQVVEGWVTDANNKPTIASIQLVSFQYRGQPHILATLQDVTERNEQERLLKNAHDELEVRVHQRTEQLEMLYKELESFSYSISHDLRAPLRALDGMSSILLEDYSSELDSDGKYCLDRIRHAAIRMGQLVDDILEFSRVSQAPIVDSDVDLTELVHESIESFKELDRSRQVEFKIEPGVTVRGDQTLLSSAISNLIGNAWKYSRNKESATIEFGVRKDDNGDRVYYIRDNGAGFDMEYSSRLFKAFQRLHSDSEFEGTGIGLTTVQRIIHRHGGEIWAEAKVDEGATFYFTLGQDRASHI